MNVQVLTDGSWFDKDEATRYEPCYYISPDGSQMICAPTNSAYIHSELWRTRTGAWVIREWTAGHERWYRISPQQACAWLMRNKNDVPAELISYMAESQI